MKIDEAGESQITRSVRLLMNIVFKSNFLKAAKVILLVKIPALGLLTGVFLYYLTHVQELVTWANVYLIVLGMKIGLAQPPRKSTEG